MSDTFREIVATALSLLAVAIMFLTLAWLNDGQRRIVHFAISQGLALAMAIHAVHLSKRNRRIIPVLALFFIVGFLAWEVCALIVHLNRS